MPLPNRRPFEADRIQLVDPTHKCGPSLWAHVFAADPAFSLDPAKLFSALCLWAWLLEPFDPARGPSSSIQLVETALQACDPLSLNHESVTSGPKFHNMSGGPFGPAMAP